MRELFREGIDYFKVNRDHPLVREYLQTHPHIKSRVFYLLSASCYAVCLINANTEQSKAARTYMAKMNLIAIKMVTSVLITKIEDLEMLNININENLETADNNLEHSENQEERIIIQYQRDMAKLQKRYDKLLDTRDAKKEKLLAKTKKNSSRPRVEKLLNKTRRSCSLCDLITHRFAEGKIPIERVDIPNKDVRLANPGYACKAFTRMKSHVLLKKEVPKEILHIVEESCILMDTFSTKFTEFELRVGLKIDTSDSRFANRNYGEDMFRKLVEAAALMEYDDSSDDDGDIDLDEL